MTFEKARKDQIAKDAKWISENVGSDVAVDFLNAMGYPMSPNYLRRTWSMTEAEKTWEMCMKLYHFEDLPKDTLDAIKNIFMFGWKMSATCTKETIIKSINIMED